MAGGHRPRGRRLEEVAGIAQALSDTGRLRVLAALRAGELCVCQVIRLLGLSPSTVSRHLAVLHRVGLVESRKEGRWMYYRLPEESEGRETGGFMGWVLRTLEGDPVIREDRKRLREIRKLPREELCRVREKR